ncbi:hypothetical protein CRUP_008195 [Coryphaenoides rupestris]|nr:hypothetical protein CRUP_008195 [Coryphaenoides rupestris]
MVGDGILNVTLKSPVPLNDNEWHFVQAEINVKVARIKVDWQPWTVKRFPGQTFVTMEFTHPILVGAANRTLRPFLGCMRGLRMNGVPLDLESKVNEEQGIRRNCTGECLNASIPCRNSGQCIEGYASYTCDCNNTAFDGFYCHKGEIGSWLRYNIRKKPISDEAAWANWIDPHYDNFSLGYNDTADDVEFSFSTLHTPAVLLYISSFVQDYIAVILKVDGSVDLRYRLGLITHKYQLTHRNLADGYPHYINITRHNRTIKSQPRPQRGPHSHPHASASCFLFFPLRNRPTSTRRSSGTTRRASSAASRGVPLQRVRAAQVAVPAPNETDPPVTTQGYVSESVCGAFTPVLGYVPWEADPWFTTIVLLALLLLLGGLYSLYVYLYQQKGSYLTNEPKHLESPSSSRPLTDTLRKEKRGELAEEFRSD